MASRYNNLMVITFPPETAQEQKVFDFQKVDQQMRSPYAKMYEFSCILIVLLSPNTRERSWNIKLAPESRNINPEKVDLTKWSFFSKTIWCTFECPTFLSYFSLMLRSKQCKNPHRYPVYIVMFWLSSRKNYIFLCLSGSCLFFSVCERKKWVGATPPPPCICGSDSWWHGCSGNELCSFGRKREGGKILMHHRFLPLSLVLSSIYQGYLLKDIISSHR